MIFASVVRDSVSSTKIRLTTLELTYPRFVHAELMTHRAFSRNAASSRAIPVHKVHEAIKHTPVIPVLWGKNKRGMQAGSEITGFKLLAAKALWAAHRRMSIMMSYALAKCDVHKQHVNRLTEAHQHIKVLVTSTDWENFFTLRDHGDAQPEMQEVAQAIISAMESSIPQVVRERQWHLPYVTNEDYKTVLGCYEGLSDEAGEEVAREQVIKDLHAISVARCARVSYTTITRDMDKKRQLDNDLLLGRKLAHQFPMHASPLEHVATPIPATDDVKRSSNFRGWYQYRKSISGECIPDRLYEGPAALYDYSFTLMPLETSQL